MRGYSRIEVSPLLATQETLSSVGTTHLVGILEENVFALGLFESQISDCSDDSPSVSEVDIVLLSKVAGFRGLSTENDVSGGITGGSTRNPSELKKARIVKFLLSSSRKETVEKFQTYPIFN